MSVTSTTPRRPNQPPPPPCTPTSKLTLPSVRLSLCMPPSTPSKTSSSSPSSAPASPLVHQGFVAKRSHGRFWQKKEWTLPWLIVDRSSRTLRVHTDSEVLRHPELKPHRSYPLQGLEVMVKENQNRREEDFEGKAKWSFDLILKLAGKKMELGCESREDRQRWIDFFDLCKRDTAEGEKENTKGGKGKQPRAAAPSPTSQSLMSPPRPPKKPAMASSTLTAPIQPHPTPSTPLADRSNLQTYVEEEKEQLTPAPASPSVSISTPTPSQTSSYLSKAIAAGTAVQMMVGRAPPALPPAVEVKAEERKAAPALPISSPKPSAPRATPAHHPPAPPAPASSPMPIPPQAESTSLPPPVVTPFTPPRPSAPLPPLPPSPTLILPFSTTPSSPSLPHPDSTSTLAASLLSHHSTLVDAASTVGSLAWMDEYQTLLLKARGSSSVNSGVVYAAHLHTLQAQFRQHCERWARRVVEEYSLPVALKTVKPVREEVEREKMVYLVEGIGLAFAQAGEEDEEEYLHQAADLDPHSPQPLEMSISAARLADQLAYKQATHELHALQAMLAIQLPSSLCLPLVMTVDYLGFRVKCTATLPIYDQTALVWGRDAQAGVWRSTEAAEAMLTEVATALNLSPYTQAGRTIPLSSSLSLYSAGPHRHYLTNLSCIFPVDLDVKYASTHHRLEVAWQAKVFRRELLSHYHVRLSSDVYGGVERRMREEDARQGGARGDGQGEEDSDDEEGRGGGQGGEGVGVGEDEEEKEAKAAEASKFLQETIIPRFIRQLDRLTGGHWADIPSAVPQPPVSTVYPCTGSTYFSTLVDGADVCAQLHSHGINLRYLGRVAELTKQAYVRQLCGVEMVARTCKTLLAQNLRTLQRTVVSTESAASPSPLPASSTLLLQHSLLTRLQDGAVDFLNLVLGRGEESDQFWALLLYPDMCIKYALTPSTPLTLTYLRALHLPLLMGTVVERCGLAVVERPYAFGGERVVEGADLIGFTAHVKEAVPWLAADGYVGKARGALEGLGAGVGVGVGGEGDGGSGGGVAKEWKRFTGGMEIFLTMKGWKTPPTSSPSAPALHPREGRRRLRTLNELIFAYLQAGDTDRAQHHIGLAQALAQSLSYPPSFAAFPPTLTPTHGPPNGFGPHAEAARLGILRMWLLMLHPPPSSADLRAVKRAMTDEYQAAVSALNYHVGLSHPLMLSLHYALAHYHLLTSSGGGGAGVSGQGVGGGAAGAGPAIVLLGHCHQFGMALFGVRKAVVWGLAALLAEACERGGDVEGAVKWVKVAMEGVQRWVEGRGVGEAEKVKANGTRDRLQAKLDSLQSPSTSQAEVETETEQTCRA